jgi:hypothetical protein
MPIVSQNKAETRERRLYKPHCRYISLCVRVWMGHLPSQCLGVCQFQASDDHKCFGNRSFELPCSAIAPACEMRLFQICIQQTKYRCKNKKNRRHDNDAKTAIWHWIWTHTLQAVMPVCTSFTDSSVKLDDCAKLWRSSAPRACRALGLALSNPPSLTAMVTILTASVTAEP